jgi:hypothetical protein
VSYDAQAASALRILKRKGVALTLTAKTAGTHSPVAQTTTGRQTLTQSIQAAILPASAGRGVTFEQRSLVRKNQRKLIIAGKAPDGSALVFEPDSGHTVQFENATWTLQGFDRVAPDGGAPIVFIGDVTR